MADSFADWIQSLTTPPPPAGGTNGGQMPAGVPPVTPPPPAGGTNGGQMPAGVPPVTPPPPADGTNGGQMPADVPPVTPPPPLPGGQMGNTNGLQGMADGGGVRLPTTPLTVPGTQAALGTAGRAQQTLDQTGSFARRHLEQLASSPFATLADNIAMHNLSAQTQRAAKGMAANVTGDFFNRGQASGAESTSLGSALTAVQTQAANEIAKQQGEQIGAADLRRTEALKSLKEFMPDQSAILGAQGEAGKTQAELAQAGPGMQEATAKAKIESELANTKFTKAQADMLSAADPANAGFYQAQVGLSLGAMPGVLGALVDAYQKFEEGQGGRGGRSQWLKTGFENANTNAQTNVANTSAFIQLQKLIPELNNMDADTQEKYARAFYTHETTDPTVQKYLADRGYTVALTTTEDALRPGRVANEAAESDLKKAQADSERANADFTRAKSSAEVAKIWSETAYNHQLTLSAASEQKIKELFAPLQAAGYVLKNTADGISNDMERLKLGIARLTSNEAIASIKLHYADQVLAYDNARAQFLGLLTDEPIVGPAVARATEQQGYNAGYNPNAFRDLLGVATGPLKVIEGTATSDYQQYYSSGLPVHDKNGNLTRPGRNRNAPNVVIDMLSNRDYFAHLDELKARRDQVNGELQQIANLAVGALQSAPTPKRNPVTPSPQYAPEWQLDTTVTGDSALPHNTSLAPPKDYTKEQDYQTIFNYMKTKNPPFLEVVKMLTDSGHSQEDAEGMVYYIAGLGK